MTELEPGQRNREALTDATLMCYLRIAKHLSSVMGERRAIETLAQAFAVLNVSKTSSAEELLDRQLLTSWFNLAYGSLRWDQMVDTNGDRIADTRFSQVLSTAEGVRPNASVPRQRLIDQKNILERVNGK